METIPERGRTDASAGRELPRSLSADKGVDDCLKMKYDNRS